MAWFFSLGQMLQYSRHPHDLTVRVVFVYLLAKLLSLIESLVGYVCIKFIKLP